MLNSDDFTHRLQLLLDHYHLTASAFADSINVQRSGISHILSGRNKPSLDFVMRVTDVYKDVSLSWLLYGKGKFPNVVDKNSVPTEKIEEEALKVPNSVKQSAGTNLFSEAIDNVQSDLDLPEPINKAKQAVKTPHITNIVVFYDDGTFSSYNPRR